MANSNNRLIVADDDAAARQALSVVGRNRGFEIKAVRSGVDFKELYRQFDATDIVMDLSLSDSDAIEQLRFLAKARSCARITLIAEHDAKLLGAARAFGTSKGLNMVGVMQKPLHTSKLEELFTGMMEASRQPSVDDLEHAIDAQQLTVLYQPKVGLASGVSANVAETEALVRWRHPDLGMLTPDKFLSLAGEGGLFAPLTETVARQVFQQIHSWERAGSKISVAINLPPQLLTDLSLPDEFEKMAKSQDVSTSRITVEITETGIMEDPTAAMEILTRFRLKGFKLSLDDFGTGFSSITQLREMPFTELKIDRSFVQDVDHSEDARAIVRATAKMAHRLDLTVCAEGVEGQETRDFIASLGCETAQGFLFSRPIEPLEIPRFFSGNPPNRYVSSMFGRRTSA